MLVWHFSACNPATYAGGGHAEYDEFAATFGRRHVSQEDYSSRVQTFLHNQAFINDWNAENEAGDGKRHTLELNKFADWSQVGSGAGELGAGLSSASGNLVAGHVPLLGACGEALGAVQAFTKVGAVPEEAAALANDVLCMR